MRRRLQAAVLSLVLVLAGIVLIAVGAIVAIVAVEQAVEAKISPALIVPCLAVVVGLAVMLGGARFITRGARAAAGALGLQEARMVGLVPRGDEVDLHADLVGQAVERPQEPPVGGDPRHLCPGVAVARLLSPRIPRSLRQPGLILGQPPNGASQLGLRPPIGCRRSQGMSTRT